MIHRLQPLAIHLVVNIYIALHTQDPSRILTTCHLWRTFSIYTSAINTFSELLQPGWHQLIRLLAALLASAPLPLMLADAAPPALFASAPLALVRADTAWLLLRGAPRRVGLSAHPPLAGTAASCLCRRSALLTGARRRCCSRAQERPTACLVWLVGIETIGAGQQVEATRMCRRHKLLSISTHICVCRSRIPRKGGA